MTLAQLTATIADYEHASGRSIWASTGDVWDDASDAANTLRATYWRFQYEQPHPPSLTCACDACLDAAGTYKPGHSGGFPF